MTVARDFKEYAETVIIGPATARQFKDFAEVVITGQAIGRAFKSYAEVVIFVPEVPNPDPDPDPDPEPEPEPTPPPAQAGPDDEEGAAYVIDDSPHDCYRYDNFEVSGRFIEGRWRWRCVVCDREYGKAPPPKSSARPQTDGVP